MVPRIVIIYASRYGQTQKIATRIADVVDQEGAATQLWNVDVIPHSLDLASFDLVILAAPVFWGFHARPIRRFIRGHLVALSAVRSLLVSVSGAASSEPGRPVATEYVHRLFRATGWVPESVALFGGGTPYTMYGLFTRTIMAWLEPRYGRSADTTRDHDYTDWDAVDRFARSLVHVPDETKIVA